MGLKLKWLGAIVLATSLVGCSTAGLPAKMEAMQNSSKGIQVTVTQPQAQTFDAKVVKVVDGDTIKISYGSKQETVRFLLMDTPETVHPSKPVEPYGKEASNFVKESLPVGGTVQIELDVSERDKYGRLLAYVWSDGEMLNEKLVRMGLARVAYVYAPNVRYVDQLRAAQDKAKAENLGIWSIDGYVTDKGFSADTSTQGVQAPTTSAPSTKDASCTIKGNINSKGEKIYHMPGGAYYEKTNPEEMFCSTQDAEKAGFRASKR